MHVCLGLGGFLVGLGSGGEVLVSLFLSFPFLSPDDFTTLIYMSMLKNAQTPLFTNEIKHLKISILMVALLADVT